MSVLIETTVGDLVIDLYTKEAPKACLNFLKLCKVKYYNFCAFHRVQKNFIAQTGKQTWTEEQDIEGTSIFGILGGDRYFQSESVDDLSHNAVGVVSMTCVNGKAGSQFFITLSDKLDYLDGQHAIFGKVMEGLEVLAEMNKTIVDESFVPYVDLRIKHTIILDDPFDDLPKMEIPNQSPIPTAKMLKSVRIGADEEIKLESKMTEEEREMKLKERDAEAQALTLELLGALPEASLKPPENVLFVCKLNPITKDKDLKLIFSRFGKIVGCEIVKDKKTMQSLQYGFIEFQEKEACEEAYFKMNNALIDGRRIKVDFSQSVAKYKIEEKKEKYELKEKFTQKRELLVIEGSDRSKSSLRRDKKKPERERDHSADRRKRDRRE